MTLESFRWALDHSPALNFFMGVVVASVSLMTIDYILRSGDDE